VEHENTSVNAASKGFRHPREIIAYAVWAHRRFALSTADVEDLLAERGVIVSRETIRLWVNRFGAHFADCIRLDRPRWPKLTLCAARPRATGPWNSGKAIRNQS
jgi:transposase-like protein